MPDAEIVRRTGKSAMTVSLVRRGLGIPAPPRASLATSPKIARMLKRYRAKDVEHAVGALDRRSALIFRARFMVLHPSTLSQLGRRLGIRGTSAQAREKRALVQVLAWLEMNARPRTR